MDLQSLIQEIELAAPSDDPLDRLSTAVMRHAELTGQADDLLDHFVQAAREAKCSWARIGEVLGVTKQAAQQRHGEERGLLNWLRKGSGSRRFFTRFTGRARDSVVEAQQVAREWGHKRIGTEHVLIAILGDEDSLASKVLAQWEITRDDVVRHVEERTGRGSAQVTGHIPFSPKTKKALALSLGEAINLKHNYIGTEHILLGLVVVNDGVAGKILADRGVTTTKARKAVTELLAAAQTQD